jgi:hypothetical protein
MACRLCPFPSGFPPARGEAGILLSGRSRGPLGDNVGALSVDDKDEFRIWVLVIDEESALLLLDRHDITSPGIALRSCWRKRAGLTRDFECWLQAGLWFLPSPQKVGHTQKCGQLPIKVLSPQPSNSQRRAREARHGGMRWQTKST